MNNKYFFLHVPKVAGTSLFEVFNSILGTENVTQVVSLKKGPKQIEVLKEFQLIGGHFTYSDYIKYIDDKRYCITFLRNPIDRFLSQYYYFRNDVGNIEEPSVVNAKKLDLKSYIDYYQDKQRYGDVFNKQTWYFAGLQSPDLSDKEVLEIAKENLSKINFVGIQEELQDSIDLLCYDCKWPLVNAIPVANVTNKKPPNDEIDKKTLEIIRELNDLDFQLYHYALKLFYNKKRQILQNAVKTNYDIYQLNSESITDTREYTKAIEVLSKDDMDIIVNDKADFNKSNGLEEVKIISARVYNDIDGSFSIKSGEKAFIEIIFRSSINVENVVVGFTIEDEYGQKIYGSNSLVMNQNIYVEKDESYCALYSLNMNIAEGNYKLNVVLHSDKCYSLATELENNFHKFLDLHLDKCYHYSSHMADFIVEGINGPVFEGIIRLEPSLLASKIEIMENANKDIVEKFSLKIKDIQAEVEENSIFFCSIDIMNCTSRIINSTGKNPIHISYHWLNESGNKIIHFEGERSAITPSLLPFDHKEYKLRVISPKNEGNYKLRVTMVQEGIAWLDELNPCLAEDRTIYVKESKKTIMSTIGKIFKTTRT